MYYKVIKDKQLSKKKITPRTDQSGIASILITMVTMVVISLIVLGFAAISRREQTQTLNQQLSTQAFYAAETGVNDVVNLAKTLAKTGTTLTAKTSCASTSYTGVYAPLQNASTIDTAHNVSYSCLLVDPAPPELDYGDINTNSTVIPLNSGSGAAFKTLTLTWQSKTNAANPLTGCPTSVKNNGGDLPQAKNWNCGYGVLRFDLVPTNGSNLTPTSLLQSTMTSFMIPVTSGGKANIGFSSSGSAAATAASCNKTQCQVTITGLSTTNYYMRAASLYNDASLKITGTTNTGSAAKFSGSQILVDSTGKAQDVLRRIQVHVDSSTTGQNTFPENALQTTGSICKRFSVFGGYFTNDISGIVNDPGSKSRLCADQSYVGVTSGSPVGAIGGKPGSGPKPPGPLWGETLYVLAAPANVQSCVWSWGEGTTATKTGVECEPGAQSKIYHDYPHILACRTYTINTTFITTSGAKTQATPRVVNLPYGTKYNC